MMNFLRCLAEKKRIRWGQKAEKRTKMPIATGGRKGSSRSSAIEELPTGKYKDDIQKCHWYKILNHGQIT